jgi:hypothetical protein
MLLLLALNIPLLLLFDNSESLFAFHLYLYLVSMVVLYSDLLHNRQNIMNSIGLLLILALYVLISLYSALGRKKE